MFVVATTTVASVLPYMCTLLFALQPGASTMPSGKETTEQRQFERTAVQFFEPTGSSVSDWRSEAKQRYATSQSSVWAESALDKILAYEGLNDGWRGEGSVAPSSQTMNDSAELLLQIAAGMPELSEPLISMDEDGFACLHWNEPDMLSTFSVYGDGTYSFFSEGYGIMAKSDSELVGAILPQEMIAAMTGQYPFESTIAA